MARITIVRKAAAIAAALVALTVAFVAGTGSAATATQGQAVIAGADNSESIATSFCNSSQGSACGSSNGGIIALTDRTGGSGVRAFGSGTDGIGVEADALSAGGTGVYGVGSTYGVHGLISGATGGWGVWGEGGDRGVYGISDNEGVVGFGQNVGVRADSPTIALRVTGKVELSRSGSATIAYPAKSVVITGVPLTAKSLVLATNQKFLAGVYVVAAVPNLSGSSNSFTIYLSKAPGTSANPKSVTVAWQVIERP